VDIWGRPREISVVRRLTRTKDPDGFIDGVPVEASGTSAGAARLLPLREVGHRLARRSVDGLGALRLCDALR
jgi:hypothetical protein